MGGQLLGRLWPRDDGERQAAIDAGYDLDRILTADDLCSGDDVFFSATGVTDGDVLQGVRYRGNGATTESLVMRSRSGTVRRVHARHDRSKLREIIGEQATADGLVFAPPGVASGCDRGCRGTGYIGGQLCERLREQGEEVRALARNPERAAELSRGSAARCAEADVLEPRDAGAGAGGGRGRLLPGPLDGARAPTATSPRATRRAPRNFAAAAAAAGVRRIVYLGGLGEGSEHLASRHATAETLRAGEVPVTYFRAAAVIGAGSESFLTVFYLVRRLPLMVTPRWVTTRTQPIAVDDAVAYLAAAADLDAAARSRDPDRRPRRHHLRRHDRRTGPGARPPAAAAPDRPGPHPAPLLALDRPRHPGRRRRRPAADRGPRDGDRRHRPEPAWPCSRGSTLTPLPEALHEAVENLTVH